MKNIRKLLLGLFICSLMLLSFECSKEKPVILQCEIIVRHGQTYDVIEGVTVEIQKISVEPIIIDDGITNDQGKVIFTNLPMGTYYLFANKTGFQYYKQTISFPEVSERIIELTPNS